MRQVKSRLDREKRYPAPFFVHSSDVIFNACLGLTVGLDCQGNLRTTPPSRDDGGEVPLESRHRSAGEAVMRCVIEAHRAV